MCGIMGVLGARDASPLLVDGLQRLEYRGYDSAGLATLVDGIIECRRAIGKLTNLREKLDKQPLFGTTGIGHTRWATHGKPTELNAHPHSNGRVALVHNGIIENHVQLKSFLVEQGAVFKSETDTEVIVHLITHYLDQGFSPQQAVAHSLPQLEGAFALAILFADHPNILIGARRGCPLAIGHNDASGEMFFGSDATALAPLAPDITYLEDGDWAVLTPDRAQVFDAKNQPVQRPKKPNETKAGEVGKGNYPHYMLKEICEQPGAIGDTLNGLLDGDDISLPDLQIDFKNLDRLTLIGCGTAYHAGLVAKYWFEQLARIPCEVDIASEFRYRAPPMPARGAVLAISQSGETADTLAAVGYAKGEGQKVVAIVNVASSSLARTADAVLQTRAGPEISVASTKAYTTQLTVLLVLALHAGRERGTLSETQYQQHLQSLRSVPGKIGAFLQNDTTQPLAAVLAKAQGMICMGRGLLYPLALEGALKLKEITYINAEGYAAGEMKHGPIALIDEGTPVIVLAPSDNLFEKTASNIAEIQARGAKVIALSDAEGLLQLRDKADITLKLPKADVVVAPFLYAVPLQLMAYHTAVARGTDVDQPRNLAKSVVVE